MSEMRMDRNDTVEMEESKQPSALLTPKSIILSLAVILLALFIERSSILRGTPSVPGSSALPSAFPFFFVVLFALLSNFLGAKIKFLKQTRAELILLYITGAFSLLFVGSNLFYPYLSVLYLGRYNALVDPEFQPFAGMMDLWSDWAFARSEDAVFGLFEGGTSVPWGEWILPIIIWTLFFAAFVYVFAVVSSIFYKRWAETERLSFAMTVPVVATATIGEGQDDPNYSFKNKVFLLGGVIPTVLWLFSTLNQFFPGVPRISTDIDLGRFITNPGLTYWPGFWVRLMPYAIGLGYVIPTDISFSIWLFYLVQRFLGVAFDAAGKLNEVTSFIHSHGAGSMIGIALLAIWLGRKSIANFFKAAISGKDGEGEFENTRLSLIGLIVALAYIIFVLGFILSASWWTIPIFIGMLLVVGLAWARTRAESGMPWSSTEFSGVGEILSFTMGAKKLGLSNAITLNGMSRHMMWAGATVPAWVMESQKMANTVKAKDANKVIGIIVVTFIVFMIGMHVVLLPAIYERGGVMVQGNAMLVYGVHAFQAITADTEAVPNALLYLVSGTVLTVILGLIRTMFFWWPVSPIGYAMAWEIAVTFRFPGSFFVAWLIKTLVLRYGGGELYKKTVPFFVGMIVFDVGLKGLSSIIGILTGILG